MATFLLESFKFKIFFACIFSWNIFFLPLPIFQRLQVSWELEVIFDPRGRAQLVVITIFTQSVRPSVRPKTSKSSDNHCRSGLWTGRVNH